MTAYACWCVNTIIIRCAYANLSIIAADKAGTILSKPIIKNRNNIMATHVTGIHSKFSGKVGSVVGSTWKGKGVMRIMPDHVSNPKTPKQQAHREKFRILQGFLRKSKKFVDVGFKNVNGAKMPRNAALSANLKSGFSGEYPDTLALEYPNLVLSEGNLGEMRAAVLNVIDNTTIQLSWSNDEVRDDSPHDLSMVLVFNETQDEALVVLGKADRGDLSQDISLPSDYPGDIIHVWASFMGQNTIDMSRSVYVGSAELPV